MTDKLKILFGVFNLSTLNTDVYVNTYDLSGSQLTQSLVQSPYYVTTILNSQSTLFAPFIPNSILPVQPQLAPGSFALDLSLNNVPPTTLAAGFDSDGQANIWYSDLSPNVIWGMLQTGAESAGSPFARQGRSLIQWTKSGGIWSLTNTIYPFGTFSGTAYDYSVFSRGSLLNPSEFLIFSQPNTNQTTHNSLALTVYDWMSAAVKRAGVIDTTQANSVFIGGGPKELTTNSDGSYSAYWHVDGTVAFDYPNTCNLVRVKTSDLTTVSSPTPFAAGAPALWDGSDATLLPMMKSQSTGISAISASGRYIFMCENNQAFTSPNAYPYLIWDAQTNTINYYQSMANIVGFNASNYIPIPIPGGQMTALWDANDKLWAIMERRDLGYDLIRFGLSGNNIVQEQAQTIDTLGQIQASVGVNPTLLLVSGAVVVLGRPTDSIVPMPETHYAFEDKRLGARENPLRPRTLR